MSSIPATCELPLPTMPAPLPPQPCIGHQRPTSPVFRSSLTPLTEPPRSPTLTSLPASNGPDDMDLFAILQSPSPSPCLSQGSNQEPSLPILSLALKAGQDEASDNQGASDGTGIPHNQTVESHSNITLPHSPTKRGSNPHSRSLSNDNNVLILRVTVNTDNTEITQMKRFSKVMLVRDAIEMCKQQMLNPSLMRCTFNFHCIDRILDPNSQLGSCGLFHTETVKMIAEDTGKVTALYQGAMTPKNIENVSLLHRTAIKSGYLVKHKKSTNKLTVPQMRWCVLNNNAIYYFADPRDQEAVGKLNLEHTCVQFHFDNPIPKERKRFTVELSSGVIYYFDAEDECSARSWQSAIFRGNPEQPCGVKKPVFSSFVIKKQKSLVSSVSTGTRKWAVLSSPNIYLFDSPADHEPSSEIDLFAAQISFNDESRELHFSTFSDSFSFTIESESSFLEWKAGMKALLGELFTDESHGVTLVLQEGWLLKKKHRRGLALSKIKKRYFKLSGHRLYYMTAPGDLSPLGFFDLYHSQVTFYDVDEEERAQVQIATHGGLYSLYHPETGGSLKEWSAAIRGQCVGVPFNVIHKQSLDVNLQWVGDPMSLFELQYELGKGAYATVHKARHRESGYVMAIKVLPIAGNLEHIKELQSEIDVLKKCRSPQIVSYFGSMVSGSDLWIMMEHCGGGSVKDMTKAAMDTLSEPQLAFVCCETLKGLVHLHSINVIHHDIKAGNILVTEEGQVKIADFGLSQQYQDMRSITAADFVGSPLYMSPEVLRKSNYNSKTDIWSLGITVIEMAEGSPPNMQMCSFDLLIAAIDRAPPRLAKPHFWHKDLVDFVSKCLTREMDKRPDAISMLLHPFLQQNGGPDSIRTFVAASTRQRQPQPPATTTPNTPNNTNTTPTSTSVSPRSTH
ncbi:STE20 family protein kinase [Pelomyxa schiedti]|nr:STE20 family protein kinase [Pelomyxa schiedti]